MLLSKERKFIRGIKMTDKNAIDKSRMYSFAAAVYLLISFLTYAFNLFVGRLNDLRYNRNSMGQYITDNRSFVILLGLLCASLLILTAAMFTNNAMLYILGAAIDLLLFAREFINVCRSISDSSKQGFALWDGYAKAGFVMTYVFSGLVVILLLATAASIIGKWSNGRYFALAAIGFAAIGAVGSTILELLPYVADSLGGRSIQHMYSFSSYSLTDSMRIMTFGQPIAYVSKAVIAILVALWGLEELKKQTNRTNP